MKNKHSYEFEKTTLQYTGKQSNGCYLYVHHWGTGHQFLEFDTHEKASDWWTAEVKRLKDKAPPNPPLS